MKRPTSKVERLVRLNRFREDVASGHVQRALAEQAQAKQAHAQAEAVVDAIGDWKSAHLANAPDIGLYGAVLAIEARAVGVADRQQAALGECDTRTGAVRQALHDARSATRASDRRHRRLVDVATSETEKREFDFVCDVRQGRRGGDA